MNIFRADKKFERFEDVTPAILKKEGVKLLLCDLDNTLRLHSEKEPASELQDWVENCKKAGVKIIIISNNGRKKMMQKFCEPIGVDCVWWARKPMSTKLTEAMADYKFKPSETVMLGDKLSTDVLAARFAKIRAWKVEHRRDII
ncbi:YqeG family HAD IIIA-type phosphatase [Candidatus Saccharibacteria bacterium]|nr:YqeG family HAD IIIA-type phosphatase [Candidatus Saccharibacteria bacterium]MBR3122148.1 YqeG family HAD IIIA-type phosphatase [Candidatus Saccharibacteria bacterium]